MPNKPIKYGVKAFTMADSTHGYILNILLYTGRDTLANKSSQYRDLPQPAQVVLHLVEPYLDQGRHVFTDRYYTSIPLVQALSDRSTAFTGTAMKNRIDLPDQFRSKSFKLKDDEVLAYRTNRLLALGWRAAQKKPVIMLSSEEPAKLTHLEYRQRTLEAMAMRHISSAPPRPGLGRPRKRPRQASIRDPERLNGCTHFLARRQLRVCCV